MPAAAGEPARPAGQRSGQTEAPVVLTEAERANRRRAKKQRQKAARAAQAAARMPEPTQAQVKLRNTFLFLSPMGRAIPTPASLPAIIPVQHPFNDFQDIMDYYATLQYLMLS